MAVARREKEELSQYRCTARHGVLTAGDETEESWGGTKSALHPAGSQLVNIPR